MSEETTEIQVVYWPRVKEILDGIMARWIERWDRQPLPGIHSFYWATPQDLQAAVLGQNCACHRRFRTEASDWDLGFGGGALHSWSEKLGGGAGRRSKSDHDTP